jgi:YcxB-like protein
MPGLREVAYRFGEDSIHLSTSISNTRISWEGILEVTEPDDMILLFLGRRFAYYVPKRVVGSRREELRLLLRRRLGERAASV